MKIRQIFEILKKTPANAGTGTVLSKIVITSCEREAIKVNTDDAI